MRLAKQTASILLTEEGRQVLSLTRVKLADTNGHLVEIEESEDLDLWIRLYRENGLHFFLLRWEYILGIDLEDAVTRAVGLQGEKG